MIQSRKIVKEKFKAAPKEEGYILALLNVFPQDL